MNDIKEQLLQAVEEDLIDKDILIMALVKGVSNETLARIVKANEIELEVDES
jgi:hypothetical protein